MKSSQNLHGINFEKSLLKIEKIGTANKCFCNIITAKSCRQNHKKILQSLTSILKLEFSKSQKEKEKKERKSVIICNVLV